MATDKDLYAVLGLSKGATTDEIRKAYRKLARKHHPDVNPGDAAAEAKFKDVSYAHDVLGDEGKRRLYDEFGAEGLQAGFDPERARAYRRWAESGHGFQCGGDEGGFGFSFGDRPRRRRGGGFADIFGDVFGGFGGPEAGPAAPRDLEHPLEVGFMDALRGSTLRVSIRRPVACAECGGSGRRGRQACAACMGSGRIERAERLSVKIPPGVGTGSRVRVPGQGEETADGRRGNLDFVVTVRPHPVLSREGRTLVMDVPVTVREAVAGGRITIPSPRGGRVQVTVPPNSQSGTRLRIPGHGAPDPKGGAAGDLIVRLVVRVPEVENGALGEALDAIEGAYQRDVRSALEL
jgi:molecular chaperone DnaJ